MTIGLPVAATIAALTAGFAAAQELGARVCIALVDEGGNPGGFIRMPGAFLASTGIAGDKAWTAASFGMATRDLGAMLQSEERGVRDGLLRRPRVCEVPGGFPIRIEGQLVGALGVSGGSAQQDETIARACLAAFG